MTQREPPVRIGSGALVGVDAVPVVVEAMLHGDGSNVRLLGSVDRVVREAFHRVLNAFAASGIPSPRGMPTVNFAPAGLPKGGSGFDLPLALALAAAGGQLDPDRLRGLAAFGEVGLDGRVLPVRGVVPIALAARAQGWRRLLVSTGNARQAAAVPGIEVLAVESLAEAVGFGCGALTLVATEFERPVALERIEAEDLAEIRGHETAKLALCAAAAGRHNLLLIGPPGSGKSALVRRLPGLMSAPTDAERLDVLRIRSADGCDAELGGRDDAGGARPFRAPHHSSSTASLLGGGPGPRPGEVTRAHHGALFLDELPEFRREALEGLRQPVEEHRITIGRAARTVTMPADFVLVAAMNPCPCGYAGDARQPCSCTPRERQNYRNRISGPLLDRFDLVVAVPSIDPNEYDAAPDPAWSTATLRRCTARAEQHRRARGHAANGRLDGRDLDAAVALDRQGREALTRITHIHRLTGRGRVRVLRLARTLADLASRDSVCVEDLQQAALMRGSARINA